MKIRPGIPFPGMFQTQIPNLKIEDSSHPYLQDGLVGPGGHGDESGLRRRGRRLLRRRQGGGGGGGEGRAAAAAAEEEDIGDAEPELRRRRRRRHQPHRVSALHQGGPVPPNIGDTKNGDWRL